VCLHGKMFPSNSLQTLYTDSDYPFGIFKLFLPVNLTKMFDRSDTYWKCVGYGDKSTQS